MTVVVFIVPEVRRSFAADEFGDRIFANRSIFPPSALVVEENLLDAAFANVSMFGLDRLVENPLADVNLLDAIFTNVSTFGTDELAEAPPDEILRDTVFSNVSTFGTDELAEAPPDEILRDAVFTNTSSFGADVLQEIANGGGGDDDDPVIGSFPIGDLAI
jgi:hypothetical protein